MTRTTAWDQSRPLIILIAIAISTVLLAGCGADDDSSGSTDQLPDQLPTAAAGSAIADAAPSDPPPRCEDVLKEGAVLTTTVVRGGCLAPQGGQLLLSSILDCKDGRKFYDQYGFYAFVGEKLKKVDPNSAPYNKARDDCTS